MIYQQIGTIVRRDDGAQYIFWSDGTCEESYLEDFEYLEDNQQFEATCIYQDQPFKLLSVKELKLL
jgi:hypothetical protein